MRACREMRGVGVEGKRVRRVSERADSAVEDVDLSKAGNVVGVLGGSACRCSGGSRRSRVRLERRRGVGFAEARYMDRTVGVSAAKDDWGVRFRSALDSTEDVSGRSDSFALV
jgi:hypothetical protein